MKIALVSFFDTNLGEELIKDCTRFLIEKAAAKKGIKTEIEIFSLFPDENRFREFFIFRRNLACTTYLIFKKFKLPEFLKPAFRFIEELTAILKWHFRQKSDAKVREYYENIAKSADVVLTSGGAVLSDFKLNLWAPFYALLCASERLKVPVYINCIGVERPSAAFSALFKNIFSKKCIKHITVRDDIKTALKFCSKKAHCKLAGDPALWSGECYGIRRSDSGTVGINVIREGIFLDNDGHLKPEDVKRAYINIINSLISRGYRVQLFTNGLWLDENFAKVILNESNLNGNPVALAPCPKNGAELAKNISSYHAIIGARMHCAIAAVSLDIPCVEVLWKPKQVHFARLINRSEWFFTQKQFLDAEFVADLMEKAILQGYDREIISRLKKLAYENLMTHLF